ncbi:hypothetical protein SAMN05216338_1011157 [Bradyrhizobium sp. Rc2d]|nr:hypothetical protein SAMN05216338_1011157 [Bradyrhizobium sp. Rc2d]
MLSPVAQVFADCVREIAKPLARNRGHGVMTAAKSY